MLELINLKVKAVISIVTIFVGWVFAQSQAIINSDYDQIFSVVLLLSGLAVIWRALIKKDASETDILKKQIEKKDEQIKFLQGRLDKREEINR
jgi:putative Mn2+ efflux pump MntP